MGKRTWERKEAVTNVKMKTGIRVFCGPEPPRALDFG